MIHDMVWVKYVEKLNIKINTINDIHGDELKFGSNNNLASELASNTTPVVMVKLRQGNEVHYINMERLTCP